MKEINSHLRMLTVNKLIFLSIYLGNQNPTYKNDALDRF